MLFNTGLTPTEVEYKEMIVTLMEGSNEMRLALSMASEVTVLPTFPILVFPIFHPLLAFLVQLQFLYCSLQFILHKFMIMNVFICV